MKATIHKHITLELTLNEAEELKLICEGLDNPVAQTLEDSLGWVLLGESSKSPEIFGIGKMKK